jgi:hypothetical protein
MRKLQFLIAILQFRRTRNTEKERLDSASQATRAPASKPQVSGALKPEAPPDKKASRQKRLFRRGKRTRSSLVPKRKRRLLKRLLRTLVPKPVWKVTGLFGEFLRRFLVIPFLKRVRNPDPEASDIKPLRARRIHLKIGAWGWISLVALLGALGLLLIALGYAHSRNEGPARLRTYMYPGILLLFVPLATRMISPSATRNERIVSLCLSGLNCYIIKILTSPLHFYLYDEFLHWRSANDILASGHFLTLNALLPVSPYYPGIEIVTLAFSMMSGLDVFHSALLVVGIARLMMTLTLFAMNEELFQSPRTASIATVFYMINPHYIFFDTQYAYESLALPLALIIFLIVVPYQQTSTRLSKLNAIASSMTSSTILLLPSSKMLVTKDRSRLQNELRAIKVTGLIAISALTFTHHATDFFFLGLLGFWAALHRLMRLAPVLRSFPTWLVLVGLAWALYWVNVPNNPVLPYLSGFLSTVFAHSKGHFVPKSVNSYSALPLEKDMAQYGSYFTMAIVPLGVFFLWQRYRSHAFPRMLGLMSLGLPATYVLRSSDSGIQLADRASAVLFVGVSSIVAAMITQLWPVRQFRWFHMTFLVVTLAVLFMGGYVLSGGSGYGAPPTPYIVGGDSRSIEIEGIQAASWTKIYLGSGNRIGTDRTNQLLMATYGNQRIIESIADHIDLAPIFLDPSLIPNDIDLMERAHLRYLAVDQRLSTSLPAVGEYVEKGEPGSIQRTAPVPLAYLTKFNTMAGINRVFDDGSIVIYDVREFIYAHKKY